MRRAVSVTPNLELDRAASLLSVQRIYGHPAPNRFRKHEKSFTFSTGASVLASQLAHVSPAP